MMHFRFEKWREKLLFKNHSPINMNIKTVKLQFRLNMQVEQDDECANASMKEWNSLYISQY